MKVDSRRLERHLLALVMFSRVEGVCWELGKWEGEKVNDWGGDGDDLPDGVDAEWKGNGEPKWTISASSWDEAVNSCASIYDKFQSDFSSPGWELKWDNYECKIKADVSEKEDDASSRGPCPPTSAPTPVPVEAPTAEPTANPTRAPTDLPTADPTPRPTPNPTQNPTEFPTQIPTPAPTLDPGDTPLPTDAPPTAEPTVAPTDGGKFVDEEQSSWYYIVAAVGMTFLCCFMFTAARWMGGREDYIAKAKEKAQSRMRAISHMVFGGRNSRAQHSHDDGQNVEMQKRNSHLSTHSAYSQNMGMHKRTGSQRSIQSWSSAYSTSNKDPRAKNLRKNSVGKTIWRGSIDDPTMEEEEEDMHVSGQLRPVRSQSRQGAGYSVTSDYRYGPSVASSIYGPNSLSPRPGESGGFGTALPGLPSKKKNRRGPSGPIVPSPQELDSTYGSSYGLGTTAPEAATYGLDSVPHGKGVAGASSGAATHAGGLISSPGAHLGLGVAGLQTTEESPRPIRESAAQDRRSAARSAAKKEAAPPEAEHSGSPLRNLANRPEEPEKAMHRQSEQFEDVGSGHLRVRGVSSDDLAPVVGQAGSINSPPARPGGTRSPLEEAIQEDVGGLRSAEDGPEIVVEDTGRPAAKSMIYL